MENKNDSKKGKTNEDGESLSKACGQSLWIRKDGWEKLGIIKEDIGGTWSRLMEIACELLLTSGLVSAEAREKVREITAKGDTELFDDSYWRSAFCLGQPWAEVAGYQKKMAEEDVKIREALYHLVEAVEDHAIAMIRIDFPESEEQEDGE